MRGDAPRAYTSESIKARRADGFKAAANHNARNAKLLSACTVKLQKSLLVQSHKLAQATSSTKPQVGDGGRHGSPFRKSPTTTPPAQKRMPTKRFSRGRTNNNYTCLQLVRKQFWPADSGPPHPLIPRRQNATTNTRGGKSRWQRCSSTIASVAQIQSPPTASVYIYI